MSLLDMYKAWKLCLNIWNSSKVSEHCIRLSLKDGIYNDLAQLNVECIHLAKSMIWPDEISCLLKLPVACDSIIFQIVKQCCHILILNGRARKVLNLMDLLSSRWHGTQMQGVSK